MRFGKWTVKSVYRVEPKLRWIFRKWDMVGMDWIEMAQHRDMWRALVCAVMNIRIPYNETNLLTS
jgi:hypothetical protein